MKYNITASILLCASVALLGCSGGLPSLQDNPDCPTTIEGYYDFHQTGDDPMPAIFVREMGKVEIIDRASSSQGWQGAHLASKAGNVAEGTIPVLHRSGPVRNQGD